MRQKIENSTNKYSNIFKAQVWTNIWIPSGTKVKNMENRHLKAEMFGGKWNETKKNIFKYILTNIWIYSNIKIVIIQIQIIIWDPKNLNIWILEYSRSSL